MYNEIGNLLELNFRNLVETLNSILDYKQKNKY